jgi:hypothetical protein
MKVYLLRTIGVRDAHGIDKEKLAECKEGAEVDLDNETAEKLIEEKIAVLPKDKPKETFAAVPADAVKAVPAEPRNQEKK